MGTQTGFSAIDPVAEAGALADLFYACSQEVDDFRLGPHDPPLAAQEACRLKDEAQQLDDRAHYFTAEEIGATLQTIQPDLANIKAVTAKAKQQLNELDNASRVISIATFVLSLGTAIAAGNPLSIAATATALGQTLTAGN